MTGCLKRSMAWVAESERSVGQDSPLDLFGRLTGEVQFQIEGQFVPDVGLQAIQDGIVDFGRGDETPVFEMLLVEEFFDALTDLSESSHLQFSDKGKAFRGGVSMAARFCRWKATCLVCDLLAEFFQTFIHVHIIERYERTVIMAFKGMEVTAVRDDEK